MNKLVQVMSEKQHDSKRDEGPSKEDLRQSCEQAQSQVKELMKKVGDADMKIKQHGKAVTNKNKEIAVLKRANEELATEITNLKRVSNDSETLSEKLKLQVENSDLIAANAELTKVLAKVSKERDEYAKNHINLYDTDSQPKITIAQYEELVARLEAIEIENKGLQAVVRRHYTNEQSDTSSECSSMPLYSGDNLTHVDPNAKLGVMLDKSDD